MGIRQRAAINIRGGLAAIVTLFRGQGAKNVTWLWTLQADEPGTGPIASWWPGAQYVTWVGIDGYYYRPSDTFASVFGKTIAQVRMFTGQPVLLSETAVWSRSWPEYEDTGPVRRDAPVRHARTGVVRHHPGQRDLSPGLAHRGNPAAEAAFRRGVSALTLVHP